MRRSPPLVITGIILKFRNDEGYWEQLELYIKNHSDADFSHGLCPECARKLYPDFFK